MDFITLLDGIVLVVVLLSAILAMYRGLLREIFSVASWVVAAYAAYKLHPLALPYLEPYIAQKPVALGIAAGSIFLVVLILVSYVTMRISDFVLDSSLGPLDRSAGFLFGAARGVLLLVVAMLFFNFFAPNEAQQPKWVSGAKSKPVLDMLGQRLVAALPENAEESIMKLLRKKRDDTSPTEPETETKPAPGTRSDAGGAPALGAAGYKTGERKSLDQLITGSTRP
jgi:membrane protein required for colicin V production